MNIRKNIQLIAVCVLFATHIQAQDIETLISNYFFDLPIDGSPEQISKEIESIGLLEINDPNKYVQAENYTVLKTAHFKENPAIVCEGFKNELILVKRRTDNLEFVELSLVLNYLAEDKKDYKKQYRAFYRKLKPLFPIIEKSKQTLSFVNQETITFSRDRVESPVLLITLKETLVQIDNPKSSIYSIVATYQSIIE